jgi:hypothetical protein
MKHFTTARSLKTSSHLENLVSYGSLVLSSGKVAINEIRSGQL